MLKNYLKIIIRNLRKHKVYSLINITGISLGLACCLLAYLYITDELKYDKFHTKADRIYRVLNRFTEDDGRGAVQPGILLTNLMNDFPQIEQGIRIYPESKCVVNYNDKQFTENNFIFADENILDVFTFPLISGSQSKVLESAFSVVITEKTAKKYFGSENSIGKTLKINNKHDFTVTGILKDIPNHSHLKFDFIASLKSKEVDESYILDNWNCWFTYIYILLPEHFDKNSIENNLKSFIEKHRGESFASKVELKLKSLKDVRLYSSLTQDDIADHGNITYIYGFALIAIFILLIACFNFINLSTARSNLRSKEIGVKKVIGATRKQLIKQFIGESFFYCLIAMIIAILAVDLMLPIFNAISGKSLQFELFTNGLLLTGIILFTILVAIIAGLYPALFLSSLAPIKAIKGKTSGKNSFQQKFRYLLVIVQFSISILLIICTIFVSRQIEFMTSSNPGFSKEHLVIIKNPQEDKLKMTQRYDTFKNTISQSSLVKAVSSSYDIPSQGISTALRYNLKGMPEDKTWQLGTVYIEQNFLEVIGAELLSGNRFNPAISTDNNSVIINEAAAKELNIKSLENAYLTIISSNEYKKIIGIVKNVHFESMHNLVNPLVFQVRPEYSIENIIVKINPGDVQSTLIYLKDQWKTIAPEWPFEYYFLDQQFEKLYQSEQKMSDVVNIFTMLAVFISCLGLLGLASFSIEQKTKEIGIRKALGASITQILLSLSGEFTKWVIIANLIAWPVGWYAMNTWLENFAYRIDIGIWTFLLSGAIALIIALLTVSFQSIRAATANPVEALRYE